MAELAELQNEAFAAPIVSTGADGVENIPPAHEFVAMLRRPELPPLVSIEDLKKCLQGAPKVWVGEFKALGGRELVNTKLKQVEGQIKKSQGFLGLRKRKPTPEADALQKELQASLMFMHLR
ncbi:unnamed protein product [Chrysoparadoxa australica]